MFERLAELLRPVCTVLNSRITVTLCESKTLELKDLHWQLITDLPVLKLLQVASAFFL